MDILLLLQAMSTAKFEQIYIFTVFTSPSNSSRVTGAFSLLNGFSFHSQKQKSDHRAKKRQKQLHIHNQAQPHIIGHRLVQTESSASQHSKSIANPWTVTRMRLCLCTVSLQNTKQTPGPASNSADNLSAFPISTLRTCCQPTSLGRKQYAIFVVTVDVTVEQAVDRSSTGVGYFGYLGFTQKLLRFFSLHPVTEESL